MTVDVVLFLIIGLFLFIKSTNKIVLVIKRIFLFVSGEDVYVISAY